MLMMIDVLYFFLFVELFELGGELWLCVGD